MTTYYKAIRPDGGSFYNPSFTWATEPGGVTTHPNATGLATSPPKAAEYYLSVSTVPTDCTGMKWPCRLLEVEPVGDVWTPDASGLPNKRVGLAFRTVRELPATDALGPNGVYLAALIKRCARLTPDDARRLDAAWDAARAVARAAAWAAAWDAARAAARAAARDAARDAAWAAARAAAWAAACRDLIGGTFTQAHYDLLTMPWRTTIGPIHPDDAAVLA